MNTPSHNHKMTLNFQTGPCEPRTRLRTANPGPSSLKLNRHPKWVEFLRLLGQMILDRHPDLRPPFLELLDRADLL